VVFSDPLYNYTRYWPYLWDEIMIPVTYESDWQRAGELMLEHGREYSSHLQSHAEEQLHDMMRRYPVQKTSVEPQLYIVMTDNWVEMTMRYIVEPSERRSVKAQLSLELLRHFVAEPNITVASATYEIVGFPPLTRVD
jgi:small-conductance mechanosensitive channel